MQSVRKTDPGTSRRIEEAAYSVAPDEIAVLLPELRQAPDGLRLDLEHKFLDLLQGEIILRRVRLPADSSVGKAILAFGGALILELDKKRGFSRSRRLAVTTGSSNGRT